MELRAYPEHFVNDSIVLRQFRRLYLERSPDDTTLIRWANTIGSETVPHRLTSGPLSWLVL